MSPETFDIIIPTAKRLPMVRRCLQSIVKSLREWNSLLNHVWIVINCDEENPSHYQWVVDEFNLSSRTTILQGKHKTPAAARNYVATQSKADYLLFLDDDILLPHHFFSASVKQIEAGRLIFGGPDQTPHDCEGFTKLWGAVLSSPLATGCTRSRHTQANVAGECCEYSLSLCNMWIRREIFCSLGGFDEFYFRGEENALLIKAKKEGIKIYYDPKLFVYHYRKSNLSKALYSVLRSAYYRSFVWPKMPWNPSKFLFLAPMIFVILFPTLFWCLSGLILLGSYFLILFVESMRLVGGFSPLLLLESTLFIFLIHVSYGTGFIWGIIASIKSKIGFCKKSDAVTHNIE